MLNCIKELREISSTNEKIEKIKDCYKRHGGLWAKVLIYAYDPLKVFNVKKYNKLPNLNVVKLDTAISLLDILDKRELTGNKAVKAVEDTYQKLNNDDAEVFNLILQKDLKCGINRKLIQKALGEDMFFEIGYMGAVPYDPKKIDKILDSNVVISQEKMDGEYSNMVIEKDSIKFYSRKNKIQNIPKFIIDSLIEEFKKYRKYHEFPEKIILNGELMINGYDRYTSNGLLTRIFKYEEYLQNEDIKKAEKAKKIIEEIGNNEIKNIYNNIKYHIWDYQGEDDYLSRLFKIYNYQNSITSYIKFFKSVETFILINKEKFNGFNISEKNAFLYLIDNINIKRKIFFNTKKEAKFHILNHFKEITNQGGEGTIVKDGNKSWKNGKPTFQVKNKFEFECEMRIKGFKPGNPGTKFEKALGAFICESEDGLVTADPSGIAEDLRFEIWENQNEYKDKIITVKCNGLSESKKSSTKSLLHPRFIKFRDDKDKADDLKIIEEIQNSLIK